MHPLCSVCLQLIDYNDKNVATHCGHVFHMSCLAKWFERETKCPKCREPCCAASIRTLFFSVAAAPARDAVSLQQELDNAKLTVRAQEQKLLQLKVKARGCESAQRRARDLADELEELNKALKRSMAKEREHRERLRIFQTEERQKRKKTETELAATKKELRLLSLHLGSSPKKENAAVQTGTPSATTKPFGQRRPLAERFIMPSNIPQLSGIMALPKKRPGLSANAPGTSPIRRRNASIRELLREASGGTPPYSPLSVFDGLGGFGVMEDRWPEPKPKVAKENRKRAGVSAVADQSATQRKVDDYFTSRK